MEQFENIIVIAIPSVVAYFIAVLVSKGGIEKAKITKEAELAQKKIEIVYPLQMQAYERLCMLMERISPDNLIIRINRNGLTLQQFQQQLFNEINQEYTHNISQQVYVSDKAWAAVRRAVDFLKLNINKSAMEFRGNEVAVSTDLAKKILENVMADKVDPIQEALKILRLEVKRL